MAENKLASPKSNLILIFVILFTIVAALIVVAFLTSVEKSSPVAVQPTVTPTPASSVQIGNFRDDELGISFQMPESWGSVIVKNDFSSTQILREISFSNQPNVKLVSPTKYMPYEFDKSGISDSADIKSFCEGQLKYLSGGDEPKTTDGQDLFKLNGAYNFGDCAATPPFLNISKKTSTEGIGWIPLNDPITSTSKIELSKSFFWNLQNQIYNSLTLKIDVPDITSNSFCINQSFYGGNDYRLDKSFACINYKEKELIEGAFRDFDSAQLNKDIDSLVSSLQTYSADKATSIYENYFKNQAVFKDTNLGISFSYPSAFGEPKYDPNTRILKFPNDKNDVLRVEVNTLADIVQAEKEAAECEGYCLSRPFITQERWKKEKNILAQSPLGQIQCPFGGNYCEIANIGNIKMLIRYYDQWPMTESIRKEYAFYVGGNRFDILTNSYGVYTHDRTEYQNSENTDFTLKLVRGILESIKTEK